MFIKMYAVGFQGYFGSMFNRFDFVVIIFSWAEAAMVHSGALDPIGVSVLRCARLLRVFKVTRSLEASLQRCFQFSVTCVRHLSVSTPFVVWTDWHFEAGSYFQFLFNRPVFPG